MASISELNIRLGIQYQALDKGLEKVERRLLRSGRRLSQLGDQWSLAVSLPLAAAGAAAVRSAAKIESLELALQSQLGSAAAARKELELLRKEAEKPGLGLEQAVRGSVSLQAVGFAAAESRTILSEFGNALALAGKGAQELDGVVLALTQIRAKGVVSAEEINQIAERLPQIRTLMQQAFGTASTEAIQKLGITSEQFINSITKELKTLPRAAGGIKNSLDNFFDAITLGASKFGKAISTAVDLPGKLQDLATFVSGVADSFSSLDPEVQKFAVYAGLAVVAAGPLAKVLGAVQFAGAQFIGVLQSIAGGFKSTVSGAISAYTWFSKLNTVMKFTAIGAAIAVVTALYFAFDKLTTSTSATVEVMRKAADAAAEERAKTSVLIDVLNDQNATYREKQGALKRLQDIAPEYFKDLSVEKSSIEQLNTAYDAYIESILRAARAKAAEEKLIALDKEALALQEKRSRLVQGLGDDRRPAAGLGVTSQFETQALNTRRELIAKANEQIEANKKEMESVKALIKANTDLNVVTDNDKDKDRNLEEAKKRAELYREVISDIANVSARQDLLGSEKIVEQASAIEKGINRLLDAGLKPASKEVQGLKKDLQGLFAGVDTPALAPLPTLPTPDNVVELGFIGGATPDNAVKEALDAVVKAVPPFKTAGDQIAEINGQIIKGTVDIAAGYKQIAEIMQENGPLMASALAGAASAMVSLAASGESSFAALGKAALKGAADVVRSSIMASVAKFIEDSFAKFGIFGVIAGAAASAVVGGLFNKAIKAVKIPAFASGTNYAPGGLALVGEKGPELLNMRQGSQVIPNNKLDGLIGNNKVQVGGVFRIVGSDLLVVLEEAQRQTSRVRGF